MNNEVKLIGVRFEVSNYWEFIETLSRSLGFKILSPEIKNAIEELENDFLPYMKLIEEGKGEKQKASLMRLNLEKKYGINFSRFSSCDSWIIFLK